MSAFPSSDIAFREMRESDLRRIMPIEIGSFDDPWAPLAFVLDLRDNPLARYVVAEGPEGEIAGYVGWWQPSKGASLLKIAVSPKLRKRGVGSLLLDVVCDSCAEAGCPYLELKVRRSNDAARALYLARGFEEIETIKDYYGNEDAIRLVRGLANL